MKKFITALIFTFSLSLYAVEIGQSDIIHCEPSLLFSDMFLLEDPGCFSYTVLSEVSGSNKALKVYLDSHSDDTYQHYFRLSYYLRSRNFFSALITFVNMVNTGAADPSVMIYEKEFTNIIAGGIKNSRNPKTGNTFGQREPGSLMSVEEFSTNFFAVVSYLASQDKTPPGSKDDTDLKILATAFQYTFANFFNGIDLENDSYNKELFNMFIRLKNAELMKEYLQFFFYFSKGTGAAPDYRTYRNLKNMGAVKNPDMHIGNRIASERIKKIFASFYLDNMDNMPQIEFSDLKPQTSDSSKVCSYLISREKWLNDLKYKDPQDIKYNESLKIIENCPGSFSLPIAILEDRIIIDPEYNWIVEIAVALKYLADNDVDDKSAASILNGAVQASLSRAEGSSSSQLADMLSYFYFTNKSADLLLALYSKQIGLVKKDVSDPESWAADFLSSTLF